MATYLQLCQDLALKSGAVNPAPATVVGALPRRQAQCVAFVAQAWRAIQNLTPQWSFLRDSFTGLLFQNVPSYTAGSFNLPRFSEWVEATPSNPGVSIFDNTLGRRDEGYIRQISADQWRRVYDFGQQTPGRPVEWAVGNDGSLKFGPTPDRFYGVRGEYRKSPQVLAADTDVPDLPERFHDAIVFRAMMLLAESDEAPAALQVATQEFNGLLIAMQNQLLPKIGVFPSGPLDQR